MNNRRRSAFDLGGKYNADIVALVKSGYGKWKRAKKFRPIIPSVRFYRNHGITYDLCAWGMCIYDIYLQSGIYYHGRNKSKNLHWNTICKLRRLRKPWEAIKKK